MEAAQRSYTESVLEEIVEFVRRAHERAVVERAVAGYYSGLSTGEAEEHAAWGELALREFPGETA